SALQRALAAPPVSTAVRVDIGDGGLIGDQGKVDVAVGGGCIGLVASRHGRSLDQDALLVLARAAVGRAT
ncbi:MAG: hypothetical protein ABIO67_12580, partial [Mycobacteriales bacterium]